ncbi:hypothetical protein DYB31_006552 [Aphanomyces astaci]|uniref:Major facilitator superfamily (MFS) profile domain-containing protein n=1 Tax=Aphanomyces astaci TaxID=112090 RepID=A0A397F7E6_APHAT|nr:hypothetical protein DYB31_006552 [Aphanomyces astaci]
MLGHLVKQYNALEHNVRLTYLYSAFFWSSRSIILDQVLAGYIYVLTGSNEPVGMVTGINGLVRMLVTFPAGYASDRFRRDTVLKFAGVLGLICAAMSLSAYISGHMLLLYVAYACWGGYFAIQRPATEALFADSIPNGQREGPMTTKYILMNVAGTLGPIASIVFFYIYGDSWSLSGLQIVLCGGMIVGIPGLAVLFYFNDDLAYENNRRANNRLSIIEDGELSDLDVTPRGKERTLLLQNDTDDEPPESWRGRWNALEGLTMFCYSGSAMAGGFLIERYGYRFCFFVTSLIFLAGLMLELLLLPIIRNERKLKVTSVVKLASGQ